MGAITLSLYLPTDKTISCAVMDSGFTSLKSVINDLIRKFSLLTIIFQKPVFMVLKKSIKKKHKFNIYKLRPKTNIHKPK